MAHQLTATQALSQINNGSLTIEAYAESLLSRIKERDATVEAWAQIDPEYVVQQARRLDQVSREERGPVHGVPVAVKDIIYTKDMPTRFNSAIYKTYAPEIDAACIAILRKSGALLLGKTTTTEFASTTKGPKTKNPHDPTRTPGGSSSGSAAAVADFQAPIALGTQTAGSVVRPASFNGIYGFKPTWNSLSREGVKIYSLLFDTVGFFARNVADLELIAQVLNVVDDEPVEEKFSVSGAKFAVVKTAVWPKAGNGTIRALKEGVRLLKEHGAQVDEVELPSPEFDKIPEWHRIWLVNEGRNHFLAEYRMAKDKLDPFLVGHVENIEHVSRKAQLEAFDGMAALRPKFDEFAKGYAAILTPSVVDEAPVGIEWTGNACFNATWSALHAPVVNIPGFKGENGMPIGLSLVAPRYRDRQLLVVARAVGDIFEPEQTG